MGNIEIFEEFSYYDQNTHTWSIPYRLFPNSYEVILPDFLLLDEKDEWRLTPEFVDEVKKEKPDL